MSFSSLPVMTQDDPIDEPYLQNIKDNLDALNGAIGTQSAADIPNGSFEIDSDVDGKPDNWTIVLYTGGSQSLETSAPAHGAKALKFTHPGGASNGGGYANSDYFPMTKFEQFSVSGILRATNAGIHVRIVVRYYDKGKVELTPASIYDNQTTNPTTYTAYTWQVTPPTDAVFIKLELVGGDPDKNQAGDVFFDGFTVGRSINNMDIQDATISQAKLKTTTGSVSAGVSETNLTLPGGSYGFYPQLYIASGNYTARIAAAATNTSYVTNIALVASSGAVYAQQRYITASGKEHWIFLLLDEAKKIIAGYEAPDHPSYGNSDDSDMVPHPFQPKPGQEVVCLPLENIREVQAAASQAKRGLLEEISSGKWEVDATKEEPWIPRDMDGKRIMTIKHPSFTHRRLVRLGGGD